MSVLTRACVMKSEERAVQSGAFSFKELMFNAGFNAFKAICEEYDIENKKIAVLCGTGNNGGDGCVIADLLSNKGADVTVIIPYGEPKTENAAFYFNKLDKTKITDCFSDGYDIIIDALFGIGFNREPDPETKRLFNALNNVDGTKIAIDIPSGVECDKGIVWDTAFKADLTLTFISLKPCFVLPLGSNYCGKVRVIDIGVKPVAKNYEIIKKPVFKKREHNSHKGTFGTAVLICGSFGLAGAAMLSSKAALRSGLGIAKCVIPESIYQGFTAYLPEAVCVPVKETEKGIIDFNKTDFNSILEGCNAVLCGCGSGKGEDIEKTVEYLTKNCEKPIVFDADGINALSRRIEILKKSKAPIILTPHPGEMARLCGVTTAEIEANRIMYTKKLATEYNCTVVLKGGNTLVADKFGNISFNILGNPGMATGGSGDVLAGITVSLLAQGFSAEDAAKGAVYLHSLAADKAVLKRSQHALIPSDIIEEL